GHVEHPLVAFAVGPIGDAPARELSRRDRRAIPFPVAVRPDELTGFAVERDHRPSRAGSGVEHAMDGERRPFELELGARAEIVGLEAPRHLELVEVARVDLIERRVLRPAEVGGVGDPIPVFRARHAGGLPGHVNGAARHEQPDTGNRQRGSDEKSHDGLPNAGTIHAKQKRAGASCARRPSEVDAGDEPYWPAVALVAVFGSANAMYSPE